MGTPLYDKLHPLDADLADKYQQLVGGKNVKLDPKEAIDNEGMYQLFKLVIDGDAITSDEAEALVLIIDSGVLTKKAQQFLIKVFTDSDNKYLGMVLTGAVELIAANDMEMKEFNQAIDTGGPSAVTFYSPGTKISYNAGQYQAVKQLVNRGGKDGINLMRVVDHGLLERLGRYKDAAAFYSSSHNRYYFLPSYSKQQIKQWRLALLVHETTHAIQDWFDVVSVVKYIEADAYIAQGVSQLAQGAKLDPNYKLDPNDLGDVMVIAAQLVLKRKAPSPSGPKQDWQTWKDTYDNVVAAVAKSPMYQSVADDPADMLQDEAQDEQKIFQALLNAANNPQPAKKP
jgi:hypothetical protein